MSMFSPLALTQTLQFLPLAQGDIDYQVERRAQPTLFDSLLNEPSTKVILVQRGLLAVPQGQGALVDYEHAKMRLATIPGGYLRAELGGRAGIIPMFLGSYGAGANRHAVVALDVSMIAKGAGRDRRAVPDAAEVRSDDAFASGECDELAGGGGASVRSSLLIEALTRFDWVGLRGFAPHASAREAGQATTAATLSIWHTSQRYCPTCGAPVASAQSGWAQRCGNREDGNRLLFPRIEPAVIVSVVDGRNRLLLEHNLSWQDPTFYSVCAGFVEAGENLEHACQRECREETGVELGETRYLGSQPWPFPASLMVAFKARALNSDVHVDGREIGQARWVTREEYARGLVSGRLTAPGKATIARYMIEEWYGDRL